MSISEDLITQISTHSIADSQQYRIVAVTKAGRVLVSRGDGEWSDITGDAYRDKKARG